MAVYEHHYKPYDGALTAAWSRFLVLPRYAYESVFKSKFATGFLALSFSLTVSKNIYYYIKFSY